MVSKVSSRILLELLVLYHLVLPSFNLSNLRLKIYLVGLYDSNLLTPINFILIWLHLVHSKVLGSLWWWPLDAPIGVRRKLILKALRRMLYFDFYELLFFSLRRGLELNVSLRDHHKLFFGWLIWVFSLQLRLWNLFLKKFLRLWVLQRLFMVFVQMLRELFRHLKL